MFFLEGLRSLEVTTVGVSRSGCSSSFPWFCLWLWTDRLSVATRPHLLGISRLWGRMDQRSPRTYQYRTEWPPRVDQWEGYLSRNRPGKSSEDKKKRKPKRKPQERQIGTKEKSEGNDKWNHNQRQKTKGKLLEDPTTMATTKIEAP